MTAGEGPDNEWAVHDCGYVPLLTRGRLIKKYDPAWQLDEVGNGREADTLQRHVDARAAHGLLHKRPGYGLGYHHSVDPRCEVSGYPDCHMWTPRPGGQMFRELKRMGKAPREDQVAVLTALHATGADVGVWWPCCWYSGRIDRELAALAGATPIGQHWAPGLPPQPGQAGYVPWTPDAPPSPPAATVAPGRRGSGRVDRVAPRTRARPRPPAELPGEPVRDGFGRDGVGYVVPLPASDAAVDALARLNWWLRDHGFAPHLVPYPVRVVVAGDAVAIQCRPGGPGAARVWRCAGLRRRLEDELVGALDAKVLCGPAVLQLLGDAARARGLNAV